jgi:hypothetical protein
MRFFSLLPFAVACATGSDAPAIAEREPAIASAGAEPPPRAEPTEPAPSDGDDPRFHAALREIAATYTRWGRADDQLRWAPYLCDMPRPGHLRFTASDDEDTHGGRKLYSVFAMDPVGYHMPPTDPSPEITGARAADRGPLTAVVQVLVKESFHPVEISNRDAWSLAERRLAPATRDGKTFGPGEPLGLYITMRFRDEETPGTDAGWVYGTLAPDGTITSSGRVRACMSCHLDAPHDRWFGLPR